MHKPVNPLRSHAKNSRVEYTGETKIVDRSFHLWWCSIGMTWVGATADGRRVKGNEKIHQFFLLIKVTEHKCCSLTLMHNQLITPVWHNLHMKTWWLPLAMPVYVQLLKRTTIHFYSSLTFCNTLTWFREWYDSLVSLGTPCVAAMHRFSPLLVPVHYSQDSDRPKLSELRPEVCLLCHCCLANCRCCLIFCNMLIFTIIKLIF